MSTFKYTALDSATKIFNPKAFALASIGIALVEADKALMANEFVSAPDIAIKEFKKFRLTNEYESSNAALKIVTADLVKKAVKIKTESPSAENRIRALNAPRMQIMELFTKMACATVDSMTILKDEHVVKNPKKDGSSAISHLTVIEFKHDDNTWLYEVKDVGGDPMYRQAINGIKYEAISGDAPIIDNLLKLAAHTIASKSLRDYSTAEHRKDAGSLKKAEMIASIIGGNADDYLIVSSGFDVFAKSMKVPPEFKKNDIHVDIVLRKMLVASDAEYRELAKIFQQKPLFH